MRQEDTSWNEVFKPTPEEVCLIMLSLAEDYAQYWRARDSLVGYTGMKTEELEAKTGIPYEKFEVLAETPYSLIFFRDDKMKGETRWRFKVKGRQGLTHFGYLKLSQELSRLQPTPTYGMGHGLTAVDIAAIFPKKPLEMLGEKNAKQATTSLQGG